MTISIDDLLYLSSMASGLGPSGSGAYSMLHGLNVLKGMPYIPHNNDNQGYVFFTKPGLNLTYDNIVNVADLGFLADTRPNSMPNAIRCMLSPNLFGDNNPLAINDQNNMVNGVYSGSKILGRSNLIDDKCAFLPISNFLDTLSPMPDTVLDVYNSVEGLRGEQITFYDGYSEVNGVYDLSATFDNMDGDFIASMFGTWIEYGNRIVEGTVVPFPVFLLANEIDYASRFYRLIMDKSRKFIQNIAAPGYFFPTTNPDGAKFGYSRKDVYTDENNKVTINLHCAGAEKNRGILMSEFNMTVQAFNPDMINRTALTKIDKYMPGIPFDLKSIFNYSLYPFINLDTYELEWYTYTNYYNKVIEVIQTVINNNNTLSTSVAKTGISMESLIVMALNPKIGLLTPPTLITDNTKPVYLPK